MDWNILINAFSSLLVLLLFATLLLFLIYQINLWLFKFSKSDFVLNEAMSIYLFGVFVSLAIVLNSLFLTLSSYWSTQDMGEGLMIGYGGFYLVLGKLLLLALTTYTSLFLIGTFFFSKLLVDVNVFSDIVNNNRRSAILVCGFLITIFYAFSGNIDLIFSSIFSNTNNATIF